MDDALWASFSAQYVRDHPELREVRPVPRPVPGPAERPENREARQAVKAQSFCSVFQLRPVPRRPMARSMIWPVSLERPMPSP